MSAVLVGLWLPALIGALWLTACMVVSFIHRDRKPHESPRASDGSRFWGRRNAEANTGKVVTKESGKGSREQAKEALALAAREATDAKLQSAIESAIKREPKWRDTALLLNDSLNEARAEWLKCRNRTESAEVGLANARLEVARLTEALKEAEARAINSVGTKVYDVQMPDMEPIVWRWDQDSTVVSLRPPTDDGTSS